MMVADDIRSRTSVPSPVSTPSAAAAPPPPRGEAARELIGQATNPATGTVDTKQLAGWVADASRRDLGTASQAHAAIEQELVAQGRVGDLSRFNQDVVTATAELAPNGLWAAGQVLANRGRDTLIDNPILIKRWENTTSAWTGRSGFSSPLQDLLRSHGIEMSATPNAAPAGSLNRSSGVPMATANNTNGNLARDAIADRWRNDGFQVATEQNRNGGARRVDVVVEQPARDPRFNQRVEIESKVGYTAAGSTVKGQIAQDAASLLENRAVRQGAQLVERAGRIVRPVGLVLDAVEVGSAFQADGNKVGAHTGRAVSGLAGGALGGWGGAAAGAAIGTAIFPVGGTIVGGLIGGAIGAFGGDQLGKGIFDTVKGWF